MPRCHLLDDMRLTDHFSLYEFLVSRDYPQYAQKLNPSQVHVNNLHLLCATILEPTRLHIRASIRINSGYRDLRLNEAVGGSDNSLHIFGKAADIYIWDNDRSLGKAFKFIKGELRHSFCQLIWYKERHFIHVALPHPGRDRTVKTR